MPRSWSSREPQPRKPGRWRGFATTAGFGSRWLTTARSTCGSCRRATVPLTSSTGTTSAGCACSTTASCWSESQATPDSASIPMATFASTDRSPRVLTWQRRRALPPSMPEAILDALLGLDITTWSYINDDGSVVHLGPTAQDFYAAFGLGEDETGIGAVDADGVAMVSIQALAELLDQKDADIEGLEASAVSARGSCCRPARRAVGRGDTPWLCLPLLRGHGKLVAAQHARNVARMC